MKSLRFALLVPFLTMAMLVPGHAQQEVMPDIFDPNPPERIVPVPRPSAKHGTDPNANVRAKRVSAKAGTTKATAAAHTAGGAPKQMPALRPVETARGR
jgi:predicted lipid-binding transport protein (Tim44 family)